MSVSAAIHRFGEGKWWYAPLTLLGYWATGSICFFVAGSMLWTGRFDYLWRGLRLFSNGDRTITFNEQPIAFVLLILLSIVSGFSLFLIGWIKFSKRRQSYLSHAKFL